MDEYDVICEFDPTDGCLEIDLITPDNFFEHLYADVEFEKGSFFFFAASRELDLSDDEYFQLKTNAFTTVVI